MKGKTGYRNFDRKPAMQEKKKKYRHRFQTQMNWVGAIAILTGLIVSFVYDGYPTKGSAENTALLTVLLATFIIYIFLNLLAGIIDKEFHSGSGESIRTVTLQEYPLVYICWIIVGIFIILLFSTALWVEYTGNSWSWCNC